MIPSPKLEHRLLHLPDLFSTHQPAIRPVVIGVGARDAAVALDDPGVDANDGAAGERVAADDGAG